MTPLMNDTEMFYFESALKQAVDAVATILEKPEFADTKIQNCVLLELIGHIAMTMHKGGKDAGPAIEEDVKAVLASYFGFILDVIDNGGMEALPPKPQTVVN